MRAARDPESSPLLPRRDECGDNGAPTTASNASSAVFRRRWRMSAMMKAAGVLGATMVVAAIVSSSVKQQQQQQMKGAEDFTALERANVAPAAGAEDQEGPGEIGASLSPNDQRVPARESSVVNKPHHTLLDASPWYIRSTVPGTAARTQTIIQRDYTVRPTAVL